MDLYEVLDQVVDLVRQRKRITYRLLQRQFALDEATLEDLKAELFFAHPQIADADGRGLIWTGDADVTPAPTPTPAHATPPVPQQVASLTPLQTAEAERRQLTVLFCDLVDSTVLASQRDPEELREVVRAYQEACAKVIAYFEGHIAQYLGDGLLVYFGYPLAHEDDAQRAVRAGLGLVEALATLNSRLGQVHDVRLAARVGIHTGLVVVGTMGGGGRQEQLALGDTPNIAARLQGLAAPDTVVISAATARLVEGFFTWHALGAQDLKGLPQPLQVYRVLHARGTQTRLDVAATRGLTPLVGRDAEVTLLLERWTQVKEGRGQVIVLSGEAGIGKSRLVQVLKEHVADTPHTRWECRCSPYYQHTTLYPLSEFFHRTLHWQGDDTPDAKLEKLEHALHQYALPLDATVPLMAALLSLPLPADRYPPLVLSPQRQRQQTLDTLVAILLALAAQQPVLLIVEDLHWVDPTTVEWLHLVVDQAPTTALCLLLTYRPEFQPPWGFRAHVTPLTLTRLPQTQTEAMLMRVAGSKALPTELRQQIMVRTDGVPLFVEELTKMVLESGLLQEREDRYELVGPLPPLAIPTTLQDSLTARLDRLAGVKMVAQLGAVLGREFSYEMIQAVARIDEATLQFGLGRLVDAGLLYQWGHLPQATYLFKHALIQDTAYQSLLRSTRQQYHQHIAHVLMEQFPDTVETQPELVAHHYTEAGLAEPAVALWQQAGEQAMKRSAHLEAIAHLRQGLELLKTLPDTPARTQRELTLQITLGVPLQATKGYTAPEVEQTYTRAQELCHQVGDTPQLLPVLHGLYRFYLVRAEHETAYEFGRQCLRLAQNLQESSLLLEAYRPLGLTSFYLGQLTASRRYLEQAIALYDPQQHRSHAFLYTTDPGATCLSFAALTLWHLGYPDQALQKSQEAVRLAQELAHPLSQALVLAYAACFHQCRREVEIVYERAEAAIGLSTEVGIAQRLAQGTVLRGWALVMQGQGEAGIAQISQGQALWRAVGGDLAQPWFLALLAEAYSVLGKSEEGLLVLSEALVLVNKHRECHYEAELHRLRGELLLTQVIPDAYQAEACFQHALSVARSQDAKSLELRAAMSLGRLWQQQGKRDAAHALLAPVYDWFTEGFDTADLQEAKALLEELAG